MSPLKMLIVMSLRCGYRRAWVT